MSTLHFLCAGAAQGLVKALQDRFIAETGATLRGHFGAVGAMKEALLASEPCDLFIVTDAMVNALCADAALHPEGRAQLGRVRTGIAVRCGGALPDVSSPEALSVALLAADAIYFPDPVRATAGIHFAKVMQQLGIHGLLQSRFRTFPNGATSMRELAAARSPQPIGCTQISEILYSPGVTLVGALPPEFELSTTYTAAVSTKAAEPALARHFIEMLVGADTAALRVAGGFET